MKVAVTWPINESALQKLRTAHEVAVNTEQRNLSPSELATFVKGADAILCLLTNKITPEVLDAAGPQLKIIATMSVGYDHIDLAACAERHIVVTNTPDVLNNAVAEHTMALVLALAKSIPQADTFMRSGNYQGWDPMLFVGPELAGKVMGIVGLGRIGSRVAQIAGYGLGMAIAYNDMKPNPEFEAKYNARYFSLDDLLPIADVVSLHVPLLPATQHLMNADRLAKMKPTAYLINTSRGPVVDEAALAEALAKKQIGGAGLDVYEHEPTVTPELLGLTNVIMTPHTASATREARDAMAVKSADNILAVLASQPALDPVKMPQA